MKVLSLFDGISCGQVALQRAGIPVEVYFASEIDKYAISVTQKNYPNTIQIGCRKLTPLEYERLQTLPDNYTQGLSDSRRYSAIGNGWTVDVIAHIFKGLKNTTN